MWLLNTFAARVMIYQSYNLCIWLLLKASLMYFWLYLKARNANTVIVGNTGDRTVCGFFGKTG